MDQNFFGVLHSWCYNLVSLLMDSRLWGLSMWGRFWVTFWYLCISGKVSYHKWEFLRVVNSRKCEVPEFPEIQIPINLSTVISFKFKTTENFDMLPVPFICSLAHYSEFWKIWLHFQPPLMRVPSSQIIECHPSKKLWSTPLSVRWMVWKYVNLG